MDVISSCGTLLGSTTNRVLFFVYFIFTFCGNLYLLLQKGLLVTHVLKQYSVFICNLFVADLLMSLYFSVILIADFVYENEYVLYDIIWKSSVMCAMTSVISLLSNEISILVLFILVSTFCSSKKSKDNQGKIAWQNSLIIFVWTVSLLFSIIPLFYYTSEKQLLKKSGLCIQFTLDFNCKDMLHQDYFSIITTILNVCILACSMGFLAGHRFASSEFQYTTIAEGEVNFQKDLLQRISNILFIRLICALFLAALNLFIIFDYMIDMQVKTFAYVFNGDALITIDTTST